MSSAQTKQNANPYLLNTRFLVASIPGSTRAPRSCRRKKSTTNGYDPQNILLLPKKSTGSINAVMVRGCTPSERLLHPWGPRRAVGSSSTTQGARICWGAPMGASLRCPTSQPS